MVYQFPGIDLKFQIRGKESDADLLAKARAFLNDATPLKNDFIGYGMGTTFLTELDELIGDFEQAQTMPASATDSHVEATADIGAEIRKGMIAVRTIDAPIKNKYRGNPGKIAAWTSASHVEREPTSAPPVG